MAYEEQEQRKTRFLLEYDNPFMCIKCGERFKMKKHLKEHNTNDDPCWLEGHQEP
jgi:hypothetical protein